MIQSEFETRVGMRVTPEEYSHIEVVYMNSDVDKDEFCRMWARMNQSRIKVAKERAKAAEELQQLHSQMWRIIEKYAPKDWFWKEQNYADMVMTITEVRRCQKAGIELSENGRASNLSTVLWKIRKYLKAA